jgi:putative transposase
VRFFTARPEFEWLLNHIRRAAGNTFFAVHAYCVMPDHLHLLVGGTAATSNLQTFVTTLKRNTAWEAKQQFGVRLWQRSFYDHIVRHENEAEMIAWYIWKNPVRQGLCEDPREYPYSGSFTVDWKEKPIPSESWKPPWKNERM